MLNIGILQLTQHLDDTVSGFKQGLTELGIQANYTYLNADGQTAILTKLAKKLMLASVDIIFACSTPSAQAAQAISESIPVFFAPVLDPLGSGLAKMFVRPGGKATGACGLVKANHKIDFFTELFPHASRLGILYHSQDPGCCLETDQICRNLSNKLKYDLISVNQATELSHLDDQLDSSWDFLFLPTSPVLEQNFATIFYYASLINLPILASHGDCVSAGALAALTSSHKALGYACAKQVQLYLAGTRVGDIAIAEVNKPKLFLNESLAKSLEIPIPSNLLQEAYEVY